MLGKKKMDLKQALGVLSKSSPYSVSTERSNQTSELDALKNYLYIETPIEKDFEHAIKNITGNQIIFLCGSSGDGKSEIMTRFSQNDAFAHIDFHLDATHSYDPKLNAIETLDNIFSTYKASERPLVVGINLGMMANYAKEGATEHDDIKSAMQLHIDKGQNSANINFLSFEQHEYSKFCFKDGKPHSEFALQFMQKLTRKATAILQNPFWDLMQQNQADKQDLKIVTNFKLLHILSVQETIIELLMKARLAKDQFLTARALLDFVYSLIVSDEYLFDSLFMNKTNELTTKLESFDPALIRSENLDNLVLTIKLNLDNPEFLEFSANLQDFGIVGLTKPASFIRLFYILKNAQIGNNFHLQFADEFTNNLLLNYSKVLIAHQTLCDKEEDGGGDVKNVINDFYKHTLFSALWRYINRNAPELKTKQFLIAKENDVLFATELRLQINWKLIEDYKSADLMAFDALVKVNGKSIEPALSVNINLFELLQRLNFGYRPNKYDKNCVLLLDELVEKIKSEMALANTLVIVDGASTYEAERDGDIIEMTG